MSSAEARPPSDAAAPFRPGALAAMAWLHFVNDGASNFLPGVLPVVLVSLGESPALAGTLMFVLVAGQGIQPLTGLLGARVDGWRMMGLGVFGTAVGAALVGLSAHFAMLLAVLASIGLCNACFHPQAFTSVRHYSGPRAGMGMAVMMLGGEVGRGVWPLIATATVVWGSLRSLWIPAGAAALSVPLILRFLPRPPADKPVWRVQLTGRRRATLELLAYVSLRGLVISGVVTYLPILWAKRAGGLMGGAGVIALMLGVGIIGTIGGGHLTDLVGRKPVVAASSAGMALCLALMAWGPGPSPWVGAALLGIPAFATFPATTLVGQDLFPENKPFGSGLAMGLGNALGAGLMALLALDVGRLTVVGFFAVLAGVALVSLPLALRLPAPHSGA